MVLDCGGNPALAGATPLLPRSQTSSQSGVTAAALQDASRHSPATGIRVTPPSRLSWHHKRRLMFAVFIQRRPIHSVFVGQTRQIKIRCPAARGRGRAVENFQIAGNKLRLHFLVPERQQFPRLLHRCAKSRLGRDAEKTQFSDRTDGKGLSFLPSDDALVMLVVCPQPRQQGGHIQQVGHGN